MATTHRPLSAVGNQQTVLALVRDVALAGDDLAVPVAEREAFQAVLAEPDRYRGVALMVEHLAGLWRRYAPIREVMRGAAGGGDRAFATCGSSVSSSAWLEPVPSSTSW